LLGPIVSSRSLGPEPCTSTTAGHGPEPTGVVSVPGRGQSPSAPTVTSRRSTSPAYDGASQASAVADSPGVPEAGWKNRPAMRRSASKTTRMSRSERSNRLVAMTAS